MDFPLQQSSSASRHFSDGRGNFDMRNWLTPRRMWDQAFLMRHVPGEAFADYDRVLGQRFIVSGMTSGAIKG